MEKVYEVKVEFEIVSQHFMKVLAIGNTEEEAKNLKFK